MRILNPRRLPNWPTVAADSLRAGQIGVHPTDTTYGLAVDALNQFALSQLNNLKGRSNKGYIVVVRNIRSSLR